MCSSVTKSPFLLFSAKKFTGIPMCALLANKRYELLYNCGIQLLHIGRPLAAFECLMEAVQVYHFNPRLWLRLAECCISANKGVCMYAVNVFEHFDGDLSFLPVYSLSFLPLSRKRLTGCCCHPARPAVMAPKFVNAKSLGQA